jgi:predicted nucleic acid-binding Zn ribbon protein
MAVYLYECLLDGVIEKVFQIGTAPETLKCKVCKDEMKRKYTANAAIFRGNGWGGKP